MGAKLHKTIKMCTGEVPSWDGKRRFKRWREIGIVIEHEANGNKWLELRIHGDVLNPVLFQQAKKYAIPEGDSMAYAQLVDPPRRMTDPTVRPDEEGPTEGGEGESGE